MKKILLSLLIIISSFLDSKGQIYCTPAPSSVDGDGITNVSIPTGVNNATTAEAGNYGDYSAQTATVYQGTSVPVNITYSTAYTYDTKIWIDFNDDFDFDDVGEEVYSGTSLSANPTVLAASFNLAIAAPLGVHRLRIGGLDSGPVTSCYTGSYGTFEDYSVDIQTMAACSGAPNAGTATSSNTLLCSSQNVNLSLSGSTSAVGLTYEWQSSPDGSTWTSIATATAIATTQSVTATTYYQCIVSCSTNTAASTPIQVLVAGTTTNTVPYFDGFEGITQNNQLPNCSWMSSSPYMRRTHRRRKLTENR